MQVYSVSNTLPASRQQKFEAAKFYRVPPELQKIMKDNDDFAYMAKHFDIDITASVRPKLTDPFGWRLPRVDEKGYLTCSMSPVDGADVSRNRFFIATNEKLFAPLNKHVNSLLEIFKDLALKERIERLF